MYVCPLADGCPRGARCTEVGCSMLMPAPDPAILNRRDELLARLREAVPDGVIEDEASRRAYDQDALTAYRQLPFVVVLPSSTEQVAAVLRVCSSMGVKV